MYKTSAFSLVIMLLLLCYLLYEVKELKQSIAFQASSGAHQHQQQQRLHECSNSPAKFTCPKDDGFDRERIVFVHMPKTGGTSFRSWLQIHFSPANRSWLYHTKPAKGWFTNNHLVASFESGHAGAGLMLQGARVNATVVTVLRNPTSRLLSYYHYAHHLKHHNIHKFASFEQFVDSLDVDDENSDEMEKMKNKTETRRLRPARFLYGDSLEEAQAFLEKRVSLVGIYERMPETLWLARELLPWLKEVPFPYKNKGNYNSSLEEKVSTRTLKHLHFLFQEEYQLYAAAAEIFNRQLRCVAPTTQLTFKALKW